MISLSETLSSLQHAVQAQLPPALLHELAEDLIALIGLNQAKKALSVGDKAPNFTLTSHAGEDVTLFTALQEKPVILSFFRGSWCPFCVAELSAYQHYLEKSSLSEAATFFAISPQSVIKNNVLQNDHASSLTVLSDVGNEVARQFGLVFSLPEKMRPLYKQLGADLPLFNADETFELPFPATYIIGQNQKIIYAFVNENYMKRAEPADIEKALLSL